MRGRIAIIVLECIGLTQSGLFAADREKLALPAKSMGYLPLFAGSEKTGGEIPLNKIVDFRPLEEVRREMLK